MVILGGYYYPDTSPTGKITMQVSNLLKSNYDISVISIQTNLKKLDGKKVNDIRLYTILNLRLCMENILLKYIMKNNSLILKLILKFVKFLGRISAFFIIPRPIPYLIWPDNLTWYYRKAIRKLSELYKEDKFDIVFTFSSPFPAHLVGKDFVKKNSNVKWITYTIDPFSSSLNFSSSNYLKRLRYNIIQSVEKLIYEQANYNFVSEEVFNTDKNLFENAIFHTTSLKYIIESVDHEEYEFDFPKDKINVLYVGSFYSIIRNPEYLLNIFLNINDPNILLHLFITSDCDSVVDNYVEMSKGRIIRHRPIELKNIPSLLSKSNILVSVGNKTQAFKPSKIFEYIGTKKPIIHFYQNNLEEDVLKNYSPCIQISQDQNKFENNVAIIKKFCNQNMNKIASHNILTKYYADYTSEKIKIKLIYGIQQ